MKIPCKKIVVLLSTIMVFLAFATPASTLAFSNPSEVKAQIEAQVEVQVDLTMADIYSITLKSVNGDGKYTVNGIPLGFSSNPYDSTKLSEEYKKIVSLGMDAIPKLVQLQSNHDKYDSFQRYILAIAIEEISKTDLKAFTGYSWDEADKFSQKWHTFEKEAALSVPIIINNKEISNTQKKTILAKYGILSLKILSLYKSADQTGFISEITNDFAKLTRDELVGIAKKAKK